MNFARIISSHQLIAGRALGQRLLPEGLRRSGTGLLRAIFSSGYRGQEGSARAALHTTQRRTPRRGSLLLGSGLMLLLGILVLAQTLTLVAEQDRRARAAALATALGDMAADYDLYVAQNAINLRAILAGLGSEATLLPTGHGSTFVASGWRAPIAGRGASAAPYLISMAGFDVALGVTAADSREGVTGFLILSLQPGVEDRLIRDVEAALVQRSADQGRLVLNSASAAGEFVLGESLTARQLVVASPALAELEQDFVLRSARVGHEHLNQLQTSASFGSDALGLPTHRLTNADHVATQQASAARAGCLGVPHLCATEAYLRFNTMDPAGAITARADAVVVGTGAIGALTMSGALTAETLGATSSLTTSGQLNLSAGGTVSSLTTTSATLTDLLAQRLNTTEANLAQSASVSPAVRTDQLIAGAASFVQVTTGSCVGC